MKIQKYRPVVSFRGFLFLLALSFLCPGFADLEHVETFESLDPQIWELFSTPGAEDPKVAGNRLKLEVTSTHSSHRSLLAMNMARPFSENPTEVELVLRGITLNPDQSTSNGSLVFFALIAQPDQSGLGRLTIGGAMYRDEGNGAVGFSIFKNDNGIEFNLHDLGPGAGPATHTWKMDAVPDSVHLRLDLRRNRLSVSAVGSNPGDRPFQQRVELSRANPKAWNRPFLGIGAMNIDYVDQPALAELDQAALRITSGN